jgi:hypothetical protein
MAVHDRIEGLFHQLEPQAKKHTWSDDSLEVYFSAHPYRPQLWLGLGKQGYQEGIGK